MNKSHRKIAREKATIGLYQHLFGQSLDEVHYYIDSIGSLTKSQEDKEFCLLLLHGTIENMNSYIELINKNLKEGWSFDRLPKMEQAILLIATYELLDTDLDHKVVINEAVNNTKLFCDEKSYKYINGVLGNIINE